VREAVGQSKYNVTVSPSRPILLYQRSVAWMHATLELLLQARAVCWVDNCNNQHSPFLRRPRVRSLKLTAVVEYLHPAYQLLTRPMADPYSDAEFW
jgi:hypothetical protein